LDFMEAVVLNIRGQIGPILACRSREYQSRYGSLDLVIW
jgi:hypothetical protein